MKFLKTFYATIFLLFLVNTANAAQSKLVCVSWMNLETEIQETQINEYAMANIHYEKDDWSYTADVMEGKLNYLTIEYKPLKIATTSRSLEYPLNHLANAVEISEKKSTVDCDLR